MEVVRAAAVMVMVVVVVLVVVLEEEEEDEETLLPLKDGLGQELWDGGEQSRAIG